MARLPHIVGRGPGAARLYSRGREPAVPPCRGLTPRGSASSVVKNPTPAPPRLRVRKTSRGFTLIDLLVAITIIGTLAAIVLGAVGLTRHQARVEKTRDLVTKLHNIVMAKYDSYRARRVPIDLRAYVWTHSPLNPSCPPGEIYYHVEYDPANPDPTKLKWPEEIARARVNAIRDLMRMEMPDRWSDVIWATEPSKPELVPLILPSPPSLTQRYNRIYNSSPADDDTKDKWGAAECLYMIVMAIPEAAEQFHESEIGDIDGDGLPEFHDAWGRPIRFLRWPAGFYWDPDDNHYGDSDLQFGPNPLPGGAANPKYQPDPFDPQHTIPVQESFAVFPLLYSAGSDGEFDINIGKDGSGNTKAYALDAEGNLDLFDAGSAGEYVGQPLNSDGDPADPPSYYQDLRHFDNIHNHRQE
ncbi:MAG: type II secretion system protein [Pirellulales bacterium]|nr:type II secretion system protein [Pirellulales bacterium]